MKTFMLKTSSSVAVALALASPAFAQDAKPADAGSSNGGIEEIVVTAQKRAENVQDVPIAISAFSSNALSERAVTSVAALSNISPNVTLDAGTPFSGSTYVLSAYIRGIGANDFAFNIDPGVGTYLDGVYLARSIGANQELGDVERIEVLKGPQGTLFGRNTIGGAISVVTHDPGKDFRFKGDVTTGSFRLLQVRGTVDVPLSDSLFSSLSFSIKNRQGYLKRIAFPGAENFASTPITNYKAAGYNNIGLGREGGDNNWSARSKIKWDNGGRVKVTLSGDYTNVDQEQAANKLIATFPAIFAGTYNCAIVADANNCSAGIVGPPPFAFLQGIGGINTLFDNPTVFGVNTDANPSNNRLPYDNRFVTPSIDTSYANGNNYSKLKSYGFSGVIDFALSDDVSLKSITAFRKIDWNVGTDLDASPLNFLHTSFTTNQKQFSQELQLNGHALDKKLNYVLGAYYFKESGNLHDYVTFAEGLLQVDGPNNLSTKNYAFFGQVDFSVNDLISFTAGGRYTHEDKEFEGFQSDANGLTYKILSQLASFGVPAFQPCLSIAPISEACRIAAGFPNPGEPLRYYIAGVQKKKFNNFSPKLGVQLHPNKDVLVYGSWSRGYKTGGWTTRLSNPLPTAPDFNEEKAATFELGVKSTLLDRHLQINAAVFSTSYKGIQLNFQQGVSPTIQNAGNARIRGFEVEATLAPIQGLTITTSIGYLDAKYTFVRGEDATRALLASGVLLQNIPAAVQGAFVPATTGLFGAAGVAKGITLPKTPKWKFNVSPRWETEIGRGGKLIIIGDWTHSAALKNDTEGFFLNARPSVDVLNASVTYREPNGHWDITFGGTNLTNQRYLTTGQAQLAGGAVYGTYNRPVEWYAKLGLKF
jgi:iron complex outermembrane recepter protein